LTRKTAILKFSIRTAVKEETRMSSVILINPFEVPEGREDECLSFWEKAAEYMRRQPGYISTRLHPAIAPGTHFPLINVAEWASKEHFEAAINKEEFKNLITPYMEICPHYPGLYEVIRT
jgi:heme-degrading monooxygenase HmoA